MKRYPAYDPLEYVNWQPNKNVMQDYRNTLKKNPNRNKLISQLDVATLLDIYQQLEVYTH